MYRKIKKKGSADNLNFDSLMDILTCIVGLVLFIIIFAVIEVKGSNVKMLLPMVSNPPDKSVRKLFICKNGRIRPLEINDPIDVLQNIPGIEFTYDNVPEIVKRANNKNVTDGFFNYKLDFQDTERFRRLVVVVEEKLDAKGETLIQLGKDNSIFRELIKKLDKDKYWIMFLVSKDSLHVFKSARKMCIGNGFATGWDPTQIEFPLKVPLGQNNTGRGKYDPRPIGSTRQN